MTYIASARWLKGAAGLNTHIVVETSFSDGRDEDVISLPHNLDTLRRDFAEDPHSNSRAREWMPHDKFLVDSKLASKRPHFILETSKQVSPRVREMEHHNSGESLR